MQAANREIDIREIQTDFDNNIEDQQTDLQMSAT